MNERIKQLADQAGFFEAWFSESGDDCERELKKFAELIVRECAKVADDGFASSNFGNGITGHQLLKHFGVEK